MDTDRTPLEVGKAALSVGEHSVGLPDCRTRDQVVEAYLELIELVRHSRPEYLRVDDIEVLAAETGLEREFIENRVNAHLAALSA